MTKRKFIIHYEAIFTKFPKAFACNNEASPLTPTKIIHALTIFLGGVKRNKPHINDQETQIRGEKEKDKKKGG